MTISIRRRPCSSGTTLTLYHVPLSFWLAQIVALMRPESDFVGRPLLRGFLRSGGAFVEPFFVDIGQTYLSRKSAGELSYGLLVAATKRRPFVHLVQSALPAQTVHWGTPQREPHPLQPRFPR